MNRPVGPTRSGLWLDAPPPPLVHEADLDLTALLRLLRRRIWLIGAVTTALTAAAIPVLLASEPLYHARARFLVQPVLVADLEDAPVLSLSDEVERLRGRAIAEAVATRFALHMRVEFDASLAPPGLIDRLKIALTGTEDAVTTTGAEAIAPVLNAYYSRLSVWRELESQLIQVGFTSSDPELAAAIPNAIIEIYRKNREASHAERVEGAIAGLDLRMTARHSDLSRAEAEVTAFRAENGVASGVRSAALESGRMTLIDAQLSKLDEERSTIASKIAAAESAASVVDGALPGEPDGLLEMREALEERRREADSISARYGAGYPDFRTELSRVAKIETGIRVQVAGWIETMRITLAGLDARRAALLEERATGEVTLAHSLRVEAAEADLVHRVAVLRQGLAVLEDRRRALEARREQAALDLEVLSPSVVPVRPEGRGRKVNLALSGLAALMVALTVAGIREAMDDRLRSLVQLGDLPDLFPLGTLPRPAARHRLRADPGADPVVADAVRATLTRLRAAGDGTLPSSLAVTEGRAGDGALEVANLLAQELTATGRRVLLVDAVPRPGRNRGGLAAFLRAAPATASPAAAVLNALIERPSGTGPYRLPRGAGPLPTLRSPAAIAPLLDYAEALGMTVIFTCPAILDSASALQVAAATTRSLLVLRWGHTPRPLARLAIDRLQTARPGPVLALLRDVPPRRARLYPFPDATAFAAPEARDIW